MAECVKRILGRIIRNESGKPKSPMCLIREGCVQTDEVERGRSLQDVVTSCTR